MVKVKVRNLEIGNGKPRIMGIINSSPESFYKESISVDKKIISEKALQMEEEGADIIDIGGMSTAPYLNTLISVEKEVERLRNAINANQRQPNSCRLLVAPDSGNSPIVTLSVSC